MATATATAKLPEKFVGEINTRLEELQAARDEYDQLVEMRTRLTGSSSTRRSSGNSGSRVDRMGQFLAVVNNHPDGISIPDIAKEMDVQPTYLYRLREKAKSEEKVRVEDNTLFPVKKT